MRQDDHASDQAARKAIPFAVENESFSDRNTRGNRDALQFQHAVVSHCIHQRTGIIPLAEQLVRFVFKVH